jgi:hypothetical protein
MHPHDQRSRRRRFARCALAALLFSAGAGFSGPTALASFGKAPTPAPQPAQSATALTPQGTHAKPLSEILGGTVQSVDPSRYDYVPRGSPSNAPTDRSATGIALIDGFTYTFGGVEFSIPTFYLLHEIRGSGLVIDSEAATIYWGITVQPPICNWRFDFQNREGGTIFSTYSTPVHEDCSYGTFWVDESGPWHVHRGAQCARLFVNGTFRGEQCHSVHK